VEGTLIFETPGTFAGHRNNADLGRSGTQAEGLVPLLLALPTTTGALWKKEEGNVVSVREAHALEMPTEQPVGSESENEDTSFTRSRDPCTSIGTRILRKRDLASQGVQGAPAVGSVSKSGKPT